MAARKPGSSRGWVFPGILIVIFVVLLLRSSFTVAKIEVDGAVPEDVSRLVAVSGLAIGTRIQDINPKRVEFLLTGVGDYEFLGMEIRGRNVMLYVRQRYASAVMHIAGTTYVIDEFGQLMEKLPDRVQYPLLELRGVDVISADIGREIITEEKNQIIALQRLIAALYESGVYPQIIECDVSNLDMLTAVTVEGFRVQLGDSDNLLRKCQHLREALASARSEHITSGSFDVSTANSAVYSPR